MARYGNSVEKNAFISLGVSVFLALVLIGMVTRTMVRISENAEEIVRANAIVDTVSQLMEMLVDVETGERGFIITGDVSYLVPHEYGLSRVFVLRSNLADLLGDDPSMHDWLDEIHRRIDAKVTVSRGNVQARKHNFELARERVFEGSGKREMDALRRILGDMSGELTERRDELRNQRKVMLSDLKQNIYLVVIGFFSVLFFLHWRLQRILLRNSVAEREIQHLATHDELTGLPNRRLLLEHLEQSLRRCIRHKSKLILLNLDLNGFKPINDKYGHKAGDEVLVKVAQRLSGLMRASDLVARIGGDEFVVLVEDAAEGEGNTQALLHKIHADLECPVLLHNSIEVGISASIGVAIYPDDGQDADSMLRYADAAMYKEKRSGNALPRGVLA